MPIAPILPPYVIRRRPLFSSLGSSRSGPRHQAPVKRSLLCLTPLLLGAGCGASVGRPPIPDMAAARASSASPGSAAVEANVAAAPPPTTDTAPLFVRGTVTAGGKPLAGARVRAQGTSDLDRASLVRTGPDGFFRLPLRGSKPGDAPVVTAAAPGYRSMALSMVLSMTPATTPAATGQAPRLAADLIPLGPDDARYQFVAANGGNGACSSCHTAQTAAWSASQHAAATSDPLFLDENRRHMIWWQRLDPAKATDEEIYKGPFLRPDRKGDTGKTFHYGDTPLIIVSDDGASTDCGKCHAPPFALRGGVDVRPASLARQAAIDAEGVSCDVCHKISAVRTHGETDLAPAGFDKVTLARPSIPPGASAGAASASGAGPGSMTLGPADDVVAPSMPSSYAPIFAASELCATCHEDGRTLHMRAVDKHGAPTGPLLSRIIWGEDTYREWRFQAGSLITVQPTNAASSYSAVGDGPFTTTANYAGRVLVCQDCHMHDPPPDPATNEKIADWQDPALGEAAMASHKDAVKRDPRTMHQHRFEGRSARFVAWATELSATATRDPQKGRIKVSVRVENRHTGHDFPTGLPDRNVLLLVSAEAGKGALPQVSGPTLPGWASGDGKTDPARDLAGKPGLGYARLLEAADGEAPVFYLRAVNSAGNDTRLQPGQVDQSQYVFDAGGASSTGPVHVRVRLVHRLRFKVQTDRYLARTPGADPSQFETPGDEVNLTVN